MKVLLLATMQKITLRGETIDTLDTDTYFPLQYKKTDGSGDIVDYVLPALPSKYWKKVNNQIKIMTVAQKTAVDKTESDNVKLAQKETLIAEKDRDTSRADAIAALKIDGILDANGDLI